MRSLHRNSSSLTRFPRRLPPTTASRSPVTNSRITAATNPCPSSGTLSIDGIVIGNAFTAVNDYTSYEVNKFDPIRSFTQSETVEIPTRTARGDLYEEYLRGTFAARYARRRRYEGLRADRSRCDAGRPWITGDDTNGFATGVRPNSDKVFGLEAIRIVSFSVTYADNGFDASAALGDRVTVDETTVGSPSRISTTSRCRRMST